MKMTVNSMKCISWSRLAIFTAAMTVLSSCGGGQSGMKLGDDEFTVVAVQSTASQQSTSYPATKLSKVFRISRCVLRFPALS